MDFDEIDAALTWADWLSECRAIWEAVKEHGVLSPDEQKKVEGFPEGWLWMAEQSRLHPPANLLDDYLFWREHEPEIVARVVAAPRNSL